MLGEWFPLLFSSIVACARNNIVNVQTLAQRINMGNDRVRRGNR